MKPDQAKFEFVRPATPVCPVCDQPTEARVDGRPYCKHCEVSFNVIDSSTPSGSQKSAGGGR